MGHLTINQYQDAILKNALLDRQILALQILYSQPDHSATAKRFAELIHPSKPAVIIATGRIGKIGKAFADFHNILPKDYFDGRIDRPAYFTLISRHYDKTLGWTMYPNLQRALENLGLVNNGKVDIWERLPTEVQPFEENRFYEEGNLIQIFVNRYERKQAARIDCIKHNGDSCAVCGFNFEASYGEVAKGFIHVHHKKELSEIKKNYQVDPINDLVPLCPNCHAVAHMTKPAMTIEKLKLLRKKSSR